MDMLGCLFDVYVICLCDMFMLLVVVYCGS